MIYGWTKEYILEHLTFKQLNLYFKHGYRHDMERRGFKFKDDQREDMSWEEIRQLYYTPEELEEQRKAKEQMYGDIQSEVNGGSDSRDISS